MPGVWEGDVVYGGAIHYTGRGKGDSVLPGKGDRARTEHKLLISNLELTHLFNSLYFSTCWCWAPCYLPVLHDLPFTSPIFPFSLYRGDCS